MMLAKTARTLIRLLPEPVAIALNHELTCHPWRVQVSPAEQRALEHAEKLHYGVAGKNVAWAWGRGPLVILVHGWGGRGAQLGPLAMHIASLGFRAVAIDITGHGASAKHHTAWPYFFSDISALAHSLNENVHAYIGHSVGGLAMMAARQISGICASRFVCICSPSFPASRIEILRRRLMPSEAGMASYKAFLAQQFAAPSWAELEAGSAYDGSGPETLLVYDVADRFVSHCEGDKIHARCPGTRLVKIHAHGHNRILVNPRLAREIGAFLTQRGEPANTLASTLPTRRHATM